MAQLLAAFIVLQLLDGITTILGITTGKAQENNPIFGWLDGHPWLTIPLKLVEIAFLLWMLRYLIESNMSRFWINAILVFCVVFTGGIVLNNFLVLTRAQTTPYWVGVSVLHVQYAPETFIPTAHVS